MRGVRVSELLPYLVFGLTAGSIYGLAAMGLVLTYKTSGVFNFAHGAVGAAGAYVFYSVRDQLGLPWPVAAAVAVLVLGAGSGLLLERLAAVLSGVSTAYRVVATVGLLLSVRAVLLLLYGETAIPFAPFLSQSTVLTLAGVNVSAESIVVLLLGLVSAVLLFLLFRRSRMGLAMRGVVDNAELLDMTGESPRAVRRNAWLIGSCFAAASGVLFAATQQQLDATLLSLLVVQAFGAAALGAFTSLPLAFLGGLAVGIVQKVVSKFAASNADLAGLDLNVPFLVLFGVLLLSPRGRLVEVGRLVKARVPTPTSMEPPLRAALLTAALVGALCIPFVVGSRLSLWNAAMSQVLLFLSLGLLVRTSGQISLGHVGFAAIGAAAFAHSQAAGAPWLLAVLLAGLAVVPVGALVAFPAIRLSGLYLGLATLGFGILLAQFFYTKNFMFGVGGNLPVSRPQILGLDSERGYYYLLLLIALLGVMAVVAIERARLGRLLRALADAPLALTTLGTGTNALRVNVFVVSAFLAGVSGATYAGLFGTINGDSFNYFSSLTAVAVLAVAGRSTPVAGVVAPFLLVVVPGYLDDPRAALALQILFGLTAIAAAVTSQSTPGSAPRRPSPIRVRTQRSAAAAA